MSILQLTDQEFEFKQKEKEMKMQHDREITDLKQELFSLSVKVVAVQSCYRWF